MATAVRKSNTNVAPISATKTNFKVLGTFEGESMDTHITNLNGLDITDEVMTNVFESDEYAKGIQNGWYIGFLGHPEDPNCMDFVNGCIVMVEGRIDSDGKVYAKFNLIDTPVGRIVKTFIDAGVKFGISIRGAGDIEENSVDPETFVFRGFDLVSFPAYPDSVPEFTEIAASTDAKVRAQYKKVCAAVAKNIDSIQSTEAIDVIQSQFASQSKEHKLLEDRKAMIASSDVVDLTNVKILGMTELYLESLAANKQLLSENESLKRKIASDQVVANKRETKIRRIVGSQLTDVTSNRDDFAKANEELVKANKELVRSERELKRSNSQYDSIISALKEEISELKGVNRSLVKDNKVLSSDISETERNNLIYKRKIESHENEISEKDEVIAGLQAELDETVNGASDVYDRASNLDERNKALKAEIKSAQRLVREYQNAYANLYSSAVGLGSNINSLSITASTSVSELQTIITGSTNSSMSKVFVEPDVFDLADDEDDNEIVTL